MAPELTPKQQEQLEHPTRKAIYDFLQSYDKPASLGEIAEGAEIRDMAIAHYQLNRLIEVELVEKVWGTNRYRTVEQ